MYQDACTATYGQRRQSAEVFELRMDCLHARRATLGSVVRSLASAAPQKLVEGPAAIARLPAILECDLSGRAEMDRLPTDPAQRARFRTSRNRSPRRSRRACSAIRRRQPPPPSSLWRRPAPPAYKPLLARALVQSALLDQQAGRAHDSDDGGASGSVFDRAARLLEEAVVAAEQGRDDLRRAIALRELIMTSLQRGERREARDLFPACLSGD